MPGTTYTEPVQSAMLKTVLAILLAISLSAQASGQPKKSKFLLVSDLHFNPMADPVLVKDLEVSRIATAFVMLTGSHYRTR
jgi:hypothetical protein